MDASFVFAAYSALSTIAIGGAVFTAAMLWPDPEPYGRREPENENATRKCTDVPIANSSATVCDVYRSGFILFNASQKQFTAIKSNCSVT
jgi:hypothetical protein